MKIQIKSKYTSSITSLYMGILNLNKFIEKNCPDAFINVPYSFFKGKRIAFDSNFLLTKLMARANKTVVDRTDVTVEEPDRNLILEYWEQYVMEEIQKYLEYGASPIFVFDGDYIDEKSKTQLKRREDKKKRIQECEELKTRILENDVLERTPQMTTELRKKMAHLFRLTDEDKKRMMEKISSMGIPVLQATGEGEKLCTMLCIEGKVSAVFSTDTDTVAMGCPLTISGEAGWIYNPITERTEMALKCIVFQPILPALGITYSTFLDLMIMAGCDFNSNIFRLGVGKAYKLLKECKSIENLPEKLKKDVPILNHVRCREIFKREKSEDICRNTIVLSCESNSDGTIISELISSLPKPSDNFIVKSPGKTPVRKSVRLIIKNAGELHSSSGLEKSSIVIEPTKKIVTISSDQPLGIKQEPSPKKFDQKSVNSIAEQQLARFSQKPKKVMLKIIQK